MCFFVSLSSPKKAIEEYFQFPFVPDSEFAPSYHFNGFAHPRLPVVTQEEPRCIQLMDWGLIPHWVKDPATAATIRKKTLNARGETILEKASYRHAIGTQRCIIPVNGFFEWQSRNNEKYPYYIYIKDQPIFCLAGIYDYWMDPSSGQKYKSFSIVTKEANGLMAEIHNTKKRMPAVLEFKNFDQWLSGEIKAEDILALLAELKGAKLKAHTVSPLVGKRNMEKNTPEVIAPYSWDTGRLFE